MRYDDTAVILNFIFLTRHSYANLMNIVAFSGIMGKISDITPRKLAKIAALLQETSHPQRRIAEILNVSQATVKRINMKLKTGLELEAERKGRCGRKRITSARDDRKIKKVIKENRKMPAKKLKTVLEQQGIKVSLNTLRRRSYEQGFKCRRPLKKPKLTPAMIKKRLTWAKNHADFSQDDWNKVLLQSFHCKYLLN